MRLRCTSSRRNRLWSALALLATCGLGSACSDGSYRLGGSVSEQAVDTGQQRIGLCQNGADLELIDQMEDRDGSINFSAGRAGVWFSFNDETGTQFPGTKLESFPMSALDPPRSGSRYAAHSYGSGFAIWGSGIGFDLRAQQPYDASAYAGITFWARSAPGASSTLRLAVTDGATSPLGGKCDFDADLCHDDFGRDLELGTGFRFFSFSWAALSQRGWSGNVLPKIDETTLYGLRFQSEPDVDFDFWIDDVAFLCHSR